MRVGSLFSGIEGFGLGFEQAGCEIVWQVEKEKFCRQVLARHWPKVKRFSDVRRVGAGNLQLVDCITAGVPCQDVSIAGKREGLAGKRTGLFYHFARILQELRPAWFVFENVPGLFSSNEGRDFAEVLRVLMVECGYGVSWRVLDSRYFNVAQRRERVFIVGRLGEPCSAEILFESSSGGGDLAARGEARADIAVPLTSGSGSAGHAPGRRIEDDFNLVGFDRYNQSLDTVAHTVRTPQGGENMPHAIVQQAMSAKWAKGSSGPAGDEHHNLIASTIRSEYGEKAYRGDGSDNFVFESRFARNGRGAPSGIVPPLKAESGATGKGDGAPLVCFDTTQLTHPANRSNPRPGDPCHPLSSTGHAPAIAKSVSSINTWRGEDRDTYIAATLNSGGHDGGFRTEPGEHLVSAEIDAHGVRTFASLPRGLDSARYRALGNAVTVSVARWIAKRLIAAHERLTYSG